MPTTDAMIIDPRRSERVSSGENAGPEHTVRTRRSGHRFFFYTKRHGGDHRAAQWDSDLSREEEFGIFDLADLHDLSDDRGWLYGVGREADGALRMLGTWGQQIAEFPYAREGEPWYGYPLYTLNENAPDNRRAERYRPAREVFRKLEEAGLLTTRERKKLYKGDHV
jgi:hypothetical protein